MTQIRKGLIEDYLQDTYEAPEAETISITQQPDGTNLEVEEAVYHPLWLDDNNYSLVVQRTHISDEEYNILKDLDSKYFIRLGHTNQNDEPVELVDYAAAYEEPESVALEDSELNLEQLGRNIAEWRQEAGMSQQDIADLLGTSNRVISRWEAGMNMTLTSLYQVAAAIGMEDPLRLLDGVSLNYTPREPATGIEIYEEDGIRILEDSQMRVQLLEDLTESEIYWDEQAGYVHQNGTPIQFREI